MQNKYASIELNVKKNENNLKQTNHVKIAIDNLIYLSVSFIFSMIWFYQMTHALHLAYSPFYFWTIKLVILFIFFLATKFPKVTGIILAAFALLIVLLSFKISVPFLAGLSAGIRDILTGIKESFQWLLKPNHIVPKPFIGQMAVISILFSAILIYIKPLPIMLAVFGMIPYVVTVRNNVQDFSPLVFFIGLACLAVTFARQSSYQFSWRRSWQIPPVFLIVVLLLFVFALQSVLPSNIFFNTRLNRYLDQIIKSNQKMPDTVRYYEFTIRDAGYYPQDSHLGGPIEQTNEPFMSVTGPGYPFYLRGTVFNHFDKNIWYASAMDENYLFYNEAPIRQQERAFQNRDSLTVDDTVFEQFFVDQKITIKPIYEPIQAVFHGGKPERIIDNTKQNQPPLEQQNPNLVQSEYAENDLKFYFNPDGQIYASRTIGEPGYSIEGQIAKTSDKEHFISNLQKYMAEDRIHFSGQTIKNDVSYHKMIQELDPDLAKIVYDQDMTQAFKLNSLIEYLRNHYAYSLDVPNIADTEDLFVHFLKNKRGYCTYFATALTMLAREAGFEARYVEGFVVQGINDRNIEIEDYQRDVGTNQAHAWTEIKTEELGWLPFDATPEGPLNDIYSDQQKEEELKQNTPETTPTTTQTTLPPTTKPTEAEHLKTQPSNTLNQKNSAGKMMAAIFLKILGVLLFVIAVIILLLWRQKLLKNIHDLNWLKHKFNHDYRKITAFIWRDLKNVYEINHQSFETSDTILISFKKIMRDLQLNPSLTNKAYHALEHSFYAEKDPRPEDLQALLDVYHLVEQNTKENTAKIRWFIKRFLFANPLKK